MTVAVEVDFRERVPMVYSDNLQCEGSFWMHLCEGGRAYTLVQEWEGQCTNQFEAPNTHLRTEY